MVEIEVNGLLETLRCTIDPKLIEQGDREMLEDLIVGAANQAVAKGRQIHADAMKELTGGLQLPGMQEALDEMSDEPSEPTEET
jgi:hypothetical protein